jgi:hypothetical protein
MPSSYSDLLLGRSTQPIVTNNHLFAQAYISIFGINNYVQYRSFYF